jgi:predicted extracellular nuclease
VFTGAAPPASVAVGAAVTVSGRVSEFRAGCTPTCAPTNSAFANLTITEIDSPAVLPAGPGAIAPTIIGAGGRIPPDRVIENDSSGDVETSNTFDVAEDGIDFYESLEGMFVRINNAVATGPRNSFGEISVLGDHGARASVRTTRGGIVVRRIGDYTYQQGDFNPERMILDDVIRPTPVVHVRDGFTTPVDAIVDYGFGNFKLLVVNDLVRVDGGLQRESARPAKKHELVVATYNVENLDPTDLPSGRFQRAAEQIVERMKSPDLINVEEIQDNDGAGSAAPSDASLTWRLLIEAIEDAGGPTYDYRQIDPVPGMDGGEPGGNIRVGFLFRTDRGLRFVDRPGGTAVTPNEVVGTGRDARLLYSPGRIDPNNPAFANSRKPLAGEFVYEGRKLFVIGNHLNSKGGDDPLFGRFQPPNRRTEVQRHQQAAILNAFVDEILAADRDARVIVLGDLNDFQFSQTMDILKGDVLVNLYDALPLSERYSYVFDGNSQALDHILVSLSVRRVELYDIVHMNSEFADQLSDHDPPLAYLRLTAARDGDDGDE